ncbi:hypothetical protein K9M09_02780 [Patescibacteria group bacterium]|nr:hypothetical protein [Patescibacteria group bacterium]
MAILSFDLLQQEVEYASKNRNFQSAFNVYQMVDKWLKESDIKNTDSHAYARYRSYLKKIKFICLNYFDDTNDYLELIKNDFALVFEIPSFDIWEKFELHLLSISNLEERSEEKARLKSAFEQSVSNLFSASNYPKLKLLNVSDWVKDFIAHFGFKTFDPVQKAEYLSNNDNLNLLKEEDKDKIKTLLSIYEKLLLPSNTKEGYEGSIPFNVEGKQYILNRGEMSAVDESLNLAPDSRKLDQGNEDGDLFIDENVNSDEETGETNVKAPLAILSSTLENYAPASLEYKAIKQEIARLRKQKTNENSKK